MKIRFVSVLPAPCLFHFIMNIAITCRQKHTKIEFYFILNLFYLFEFYSVGSKIPRLLYDPSNFYSMTRLPFTPQKTSKYTVYSSGVSHKTVTLPPIFIFLCNSRTITRLFVLIQEPLARRADIFYEHHNGRRRR